VFGKKKKAWYVLVGGGTIANRIPTIRNRQLGGFLPNGEKKGGKLPKKIFLKKRGGTTVLEEGEPPISETLSIG